MLTKAKLMEYALKSGIDAVAVAPASRFCVPPEVLPPQNSPLSLFPDAKSVIICAREIPRGCFRGIEEGTMWQRSSRYIEAVHMYTLARYLEDEGCTAVPSTPLAKERWPEGVKFRTGKIEPNVYPDLEYAVVACGLGEIGFCGLVITPQFGVRQSLGLITTDLEIETDEVFSRRICDRGNCAECVKGCPMGAIDMSETTEHEICGVSFATASINRLKCRYCPNGAFPDTTHQEAMPNRLAAACSRACLVHLEQTGLVRNDLKTPFRRRKAWGFDLNDL